jgi:hypothetical protein
MRHIAALSPEKIPRDSEFGFKDRAKVLVDRWQEVLNASKANGTEAGADAAHGTTTTEANGNAEGGDKAMQVDGQSPAGKSSPHPPGTTDGATEEVTMSEA